MFNVADKFTEDLKQFRQEQGADLRMGQKLLSRTSRPKLWIGFGIGALFAVAWILFLRPSEKREQLRERFSKAA